MTLNPYPPLRQHPLAGDYRGRDELLGFLARLAGLGFVLAEEDVCGNDRHVCALSQMGARRPGLEVTTRHPTSVSRQAAMVVGAVWLAQAVVSL